MRLKARLTSNVLHGIYQGFFPGLVPSISITARQVTNAVHTPAQLHPIISYSCSHAVVRCQAQCHTQDWAHMNEDGNFQCQPTSQQFSGFFFPQWFLPFLLLSSRAEVVQTDLKIQHAVAARATCCAEVVQKWDRFNGSKDSTRCSC